jgi:hypothetical protein
MTMRIPDLALAEFRGLLQEITEITCEPGS